jgi:hypothetical protein
MTFEKPKYRVVSGFALTSEDADKFEASINALSEQGYGLAHLEVAQMKIIGVMKLKEDSAASFKGVEELVNVDITPDGHEIAEKIRAGWEIIASYAKSVTLIRRRPKEASP